MFIDFYHPNLECIMRHLQEIVGDLEQGMEVHEDRVIFAFNDGGSTVVIYLMALNRAEPEYYLGLEVSVGSIANKDMAKAVYAATGMIYNIVAPFRLSVLPHGEDEELLILRFVSECCFISQEYIPSVLEVGLAAAQQLREALGLRSIVEKNLVV